MDNLRSASKLLHKPCGISFFFAFFKKSSSPSYTNDKKSNGCFSDNCLIFLEKSEKLIKKACPRQTILDEGTLIMVNPIIPMAVMPSMLNLISRDPEP